MTVIDSNLEQKIRLLPLELQREVEDFVEFLLVKQRRAELEQVGQSNAWPAGFFTQTAGVIDDPSFLRHPQGLPEERLSLES